MLHKIFEVYKSDMKNIARNWVVAVLIGGLVLLPSLYAWFNIKASWDPYGQTDQIPIGVVNQDIGAEIRGESIDVGTMLVDTLKDNRSMNWQFVSKEKAMKEVEYGNYFAVIIIPKDFSERLSLVVTGNPKKAEMEYYVNQKINAIAPKITDKGVSVIVEEISSQFISTVNGVIFDMLNKIGLELEADQPDIEKFEEYIFTLEETLPDIYDTLINTNRDAKEAKEIIHRVMDKLPEVKSMTNSGSEVLDKVMAHLQKADDLFTNLSPKINVELKNAQTIVQQINDLIGKADTNKGIHEFFEGKLDELLLDINQSIERLNLVNESIIQLEEQLDKGEADKLEMLEQARAEITPLISVMGAVQGKIGELKNAGDNMNKVLADIAETAKASSEKADKFIEEYSQTIEPAISSAIKDVKGKLASAKEMVSEIQMTIPKVERILTSTDGHLNKGQKLLGDVQAEFPYVQDKVGEIAGRIRNLKKETNLNDIIELLKNDPHAEKGFFAEPVLLNKNELFPIENYGTGMTPFYTVLSLWVGALLLISLLATDLPDDVHPKVMYFGRLLTFVTIGLLQTLIVTGGDILLMGVSAKHPINFIIFGMLVSIIFMIMVYSVVSLFGDVGKALAIVLLVLQIAGSGGTYPVVLLPSFFQAINPFLPFTYGVELLREAVGGIVWHRVFIDVIALAIFGLLFLTMGTFLKGPSNRLMNKLLKSKDSRLFH